MKPFNLKKPFESWTYWLLIGLTGLIGLTSTVLALWRCKS